MFAAIKARFGGNEGNKERNIRLVENNSMKTLMLQAQNSLDSSLTGFKSLIRSKVGIWDTTKHEAESSIRELEGRSSLMEAILLDMINQSSSKAVKIEDASEKAMCAIDGAGFDWTLKKQYDDLIVKLDDTGFKAATYKRGLEEFTTLRLYVFGLGIIVLKPTTGCDKESDNSKENTDDSLKQQQKTDSKTSSVKSPLKADKDWKEKFFSLANHVKEVEPKKVRERLKMGA
ncbi:hypothetical protein Tco_0527193 [Tanacetum coccineum]